MNTPRFLVGIDLGTTNTAVAYVDLRERGGLRLGLFEVPQEVAPGETAPRDTLPSFLFFPDESGGEPLVGVYAREQGALLPTRQISSAKSWLCHPGIDRTSRILPWGAETPRMSPVGASSAILAHIRKAWNEQFAGTRQADLLLEHQDIVLTVPASFDQEARELTVEAAKAAGLERVRLLEEPLAAFYAWIAQSGVGRGLRLASRASRPADSRAGRLADSRARRLAPQEMFADGDQVLVCDVGGGTSDFTLIGVHLENGDLSFERTAVGEHLLLGGDNLDLALARLLEQKLGDRAPSLVQRLALRRSAAAAKERLLSEPSLERVPIAVLGGGGAVVGGSLTTELTRHDVVEALTEGFLPVVGAGARPARDKRTALRELGLPYAEDAAITRHMAAFLAGAASTGRPAGPASLPVGPPAGMARPDAILFNGGFFTPAIARERILENLQRWFGTDEAWEPRVLENAAPAAAVALGAAYYAHVLRRGGLRVRAGSSRSYYIGVSGGNDAVCILPRGTEEGTSFTLADRDFAVVTNRPVAFPLYSSPVRQEAIGTLVSLEGDDVHAHAPLATVLRYGKKTRQVELPVHLSAAFTETGTLEVSCASKSTEHRWRLRFQLRGEEADEVLQVGAPLGGARAEGPVGAPLRGVRAEGPVGAPLRGVRAEGPVGAPLRGARDAAGSDSGPCLEDGPGPEHRPEPDTQPVPEAEAIVPADRLAGAQDLIERTFTPSAGAPLDPATLPAQLEAALEFGRQAWPLPVIRALADGLLKASQGRKLAAKFEARWLNLLGFCLRPGFGAPLDDWRLGQARAIYVEGLAFPRDLQCQVEWIVLWQRVAGGLKAGQQRELYQRHSTLLDVRAGKKAPRLNPQVQREAWRLLASLEHLLAAERAKLGELLLDRLQKERDNSSYLWAIGRFGARLPAHGPVTAVISPDRAERWIERLLSLAEARQRPRPTPEGRPGEPSFTRDVAEAVAQIGARSNDPLRDISEEARARTIARLVDAGFAREAEALREFQAAETRSALQMFGEELPVGLRLQAS